MTFTSIMCDGPGCGATFAIAGAGTTHAIRLVAEAREGCSPEGARDLRRFFGAAKKKGR